MKKLLVVSIVTVFSMVMAACAPAAPVATEAPKPTMAEPTAEPTMAPQPKTIVDLAVADGRFKTLVSAVQAAGLAETLSSEGPFTVFAPTDDAFSKLPAGTVEALLKDLPKLKEILLYHVVPGKVMASDVLKLSSAETAAGKPLSIKVMDGKVYLNETTQVIVTDIEASNGVIHVIDSVLLPPEEAKTDEMSKKTIVDLAVADGRFTTLVAAVQAAGLAETLSSEGPFTVFAPTDEAFKKLPEGTVDALLKDLPKLKEILLYHVVSGKVMAADVVKLTSAETVAGKPVSIMVKDGKVFLNETTQVIITDIEASNGVIHVIDSVLLPPQ